MPDLITRLKLDTSQYNSGIDSAKQKTQELSNTADQTSRTIQDLGDKGARSASELLKEMGKMETAGRSASNYRRQLMQMQKQIADLTIGYRQMSDEMKASPLGQEVATKIQELTRQASQYKDAINDVQQEIQHMSSDTAAWDGMKQGIEGVSSALQAFAAAGVLGEESSEKLIQVIARLKAIEAATNAVIKIGNALQRNSALMAGISTIQHKALAKAKEMEAAATGKATIAQKALNKVAIANPYVLLAAAIAAVCAALAIFIIKSNQAGDSSKAAAKQIDKFKKALKESEGEAGKTIAKFKTLEGQWKTLKTTAEKTQWIDDNQDAFNDLGISITDVSEAEEVFEQHTADVVRAMMLRAEAAAMMATYEEQYAEAYKESLKWMDEQKDAYNANYGRPKPVWEKAGLKPNEDYTVRQQQTATRGGMGAMPNTQTWFNLTDEGKKKLEAYLNEQKQNFINSYSDMASSVFNDAQQKLKEADALDKKTGISTNGNSVTTTEIKVDEKSLKAAQTRLSKLQEQLDAMDPKAEGFTDLKNKVIEAEKEVEYLKKLVDTSDSKAIIINDNSLNAAQKRLDELQAKLNNMPVDDSGIEQLKNEISEAENEVERIKKLLSTSITVDANSLKAAEDRLSELQNKLNTMSVNDEAFGEVKQQVIEAEKEVSRLRKLVELPVKVEIPPANTKAEAEHFIKFFQNELENLEVDSDDFNEVLMLLTFWKEQLNDINEIINSYPNKVQKTIQEIEKEYSLAQQLYDKYYDIASEMSLNPVLVDTDEYRQIITLMEEQEDIMNKNKKIIDDYYRSLGYINSAYQDIVKNVRDIDFNLNIGAIDKSSAQKQIDMLNDELSKMGLTVRFAVGIDGKSIEQLKTDMNALAGDMVSSTSNIVTSFNSVYESIKGLGDALDEAESGWEAFFAVFENGLTIIDAVTSSIQSLATVSELLTALTTANTAAKAKNTTATTSEATAAAADASAQTADSTATMTNAAAHGAAAATKAGESAAAVPIVGAVLAPIAIVTVLAAVIAAIGALSAFAEGGVVGGHSYYGDKVLARVNSGELILNEKQQEKLWGMMNGNNSSIVTGNVEFKIKGSDLVGTLNNFANKRNKI